MAEDILASEHDLTHIDSDDELLVSVGSDRNVVPRFFHHSPASVIEGVGIKSTALDAVVSMSAPAHSIPGRDLDLVWPRPSLATTYFGHDLFWVTVSPTLATVSFGHFRGGGVGGE